MADELSPTLRAVSDAVLSIAAERSVEEVLQRLVESARELAGARYAALARVRRAGGGGGLQPLSPRRHERWAGGDAWRPAANARDAWRDAGDGGVVSHAGHPRRPALPRLVAERPPRHALVPRRPNLR